MSIHNFEQNCTWRMASAERVSRSEEVALLRHYRKSGDRESEERIIAVYEPLVISIARSIHQRHNPCADVDDYIADGFMGLLYVLRRFDSKQAITFSAYCIPYIRSEIRKGICLRTGLTDFRYRAVRDAEKARAAVENECGRAASDGEVSERLGITGTRYAELFYFKQLMHIHSVGFREPVEIATLNIADSQSTTPFDMVADLDESQFLMRGLTEEQRDIVNLRYMEERPFHEIAKIIGRSKTHTFEKLAEADAPMIKNHKTRRAMMARPA